MAVLLEVLCGNGYYGHGDRPWLSPGLIVPEAPPGEIRGGGSGPGLGVGLSGDNPRENFREEKRNVRTD